MVTLSFIPQAITTEKSWTLTTQRLIKVSKMHFLFNYKMHCQIDTSLKRLRTCHMPNMKVKVKTTVTLAPSDHDSDDVVSYRTQSNSSISAGMKRGRFTFIQTKTDSRNKTDANANTNIGLPLQDGPYFFNIHFENCLHDVASFFGKISYCV